MITLGTDIATGQPVRLTDEQVTYHTTIVGLSGTGKSTAICNHVRDAMEKGHGVIVLDPHGSLVDRILKYIPKDREDDVILLDIRDGEFPFGLNLFGGDSARTDEGEDPQTLIIEAFKRVWGSAWGINIETWLMALAEVFRANGHGTLADVPRFFTDTHYREAMLRAVDDEDILGFIRSCEDRNGDLKSSEVDSTYKRVLRFLRKRNLRNVVVQEENRFSFLDAMNRGKIVLFSLKADSETVNLLGTVLLGRILNAALSRNEYQLPYCYVYVDEFQRFATDAFADIIQQTRKFNVALIIATQSLFGKGVSESVRQAALMVSTYLLFRLSDEDASLFTHYFEHISFNTERPIPHPNPADELLKHPHPDPTIRHVVDSLIRPLTTAGKGDIASSAYQGINTYLHAMSERRMASGMQEIADMHSIFYNLPAQHTLIYEARQRGGEIAARQMRAMLESYIETFCKIVRVNHSRSTLSAVLLSHRNFPVVRAIFGRYPYEDEETRKRYTRLITDLYNLRWLGLVFAENPIPAAGIQEPTIREIVRTLTGIPQGKAAARPVSGEYAITWEPPPDAPTNPAMVARIRERSRALYCTSRQEITKHLVARRGNTPTETPGPVHGTPTPSPSGPEAAGAKKQPGMPPEPPAMVRRQPRVRA